MLGASVASPRDEDLLPPGDCLDLPPDAPVSVKEAVMPFNRFRLPDGRSVDTLLGPKMPSTGEVMGIDSLFGMAFAKSQAAAFGALPTTGKIFVSLANRDEGVVAAPAANGGRLLHLSVALCVLNDTYREAERLDVEVDGVAVEADSGFDDEWRSTGIEYSVTLDSRASAEDRARLGAVVDEVAEISRAIRAGAPVTRRP